MFGIKEKISSGIEKTPMEKFSLFFLIIIAVSALVLGYFNFKNSLDSPFRDDYLQSAKVDLKIKYGLLSQPDLTDEQEAKKLKGMDSDLDGLDDYSEIYVYNTSAYLEDTDSDGILDKQEILNGTDPNCAEGTDCSGAEATVDANINVAIPDAISQYFSSDSSSVDLAGLEAQLMSGEVTLKDLGIDDPAMQKNLDDLRAGNIGTTTTGTADQTQAREALKAMTPAQIREELIGRGIDKAVLDQVDDASLQALFLQTLGNL